MRALGGLAGGGMLCRRPRGGTSGGRQRKYSSRWPTRGGFGASASLGSRWAPGFRRSWVQDCGCMLRLGASVSPSGHSPRGRARMGVCALLPVCKAGGPQLALGACAGLLASLPLAVWPRVAGMLKAALA